MGLLTLNSCAVAVAVEDIRFGDFVGRFRGWMFSLELEYIGWLAIEAACSQDCIQDCIQDSPREEEKKERREGEICSHIIESSSTEEVFSSSYQITGLPSSRSRQWMFSIRASAYAYAASQHIS